MEAILGVVELDEVKRAVVPEENNGQIFMNFSVLLPWLVWFRVIVLPIHHHGYIIQPREINRSYIAKFPHKFRTI